MSEHPVSYKLSRWRVPLGFGGAIFYFFLTRPTTTSIVVGALVAGVGLAWRAWASGTIRKNAALAVEGPYAFSRNPLYLGSFLMALGFGMASQRRIIFLGIAAFFLAVYWPVMRREEQELESRFGGAFKAYALGVPIFFPWKPPSPHTSARRFSWKQYWRNREYNALLGYGVALGLLFLIKYLRG